ncbi:MAG: ATP-binding protein [Treponema sp.]|nr:ATP-binding protein [Treponema sp.]
MLILLVVYTSTSIQNLTDDLAEERATMISEATHLRFDELTNISALSTRVVAQSDILADILRTYATTGAIDRAALLAYLEARRMEIGAGIFLVLDADGTTILRTILPPMFGDSQAGSVNVQAAMRGETVSAFSVGGGAIRMAVSTYTPITFGGQQIGVFIARTVMNDDAFVDTFAEVFNAHVSLYTGPEIVATTIRDAYGNRALGMDADPLVTQIVLEENRIFSDLIPIDSVPHHMYAFPIRDATGFPIGMFSVAFSNERTIAATVEAQRSLFIISAIGLLISTIVLLVYIRLTKNMEENRVALDREQEAGRAKSSFLSHMSHEIRTPMNAVIGLAGIAIMATDPAKKDDCLVKIQKSSNHLMSIINQILDMSRIEADRYDLQLRSFNFENAISEIASVLSVQIETKQLNFTTDLDKNIPRFIVSDKVRLAQVIINLMSNAIKCTPSGGNIKLSAKLTADETLYIEVVDTGAGITGNLQSLIFNAFEKVGTGDSSAAESSGLGLAISKHIVEKMGGKLWLESRLGEGSKFMFTAKFGTANMGGSQSAGENPQCPANYEGRTMLLAEDIEINREIVISMLEPTGIKVECAENGTQAVEMFEGAPNRYDIVFMDLQMPKLDGLAATRRIREMNIDEAKRVPIIAMTANVFQEDVETCLAAGMNGHLGKPLDITLVLNTLERYLAA